MQTLYRVRLAVSRLTARTFTISTRSIFCRHVATYGVYIFRSCATTRKRHSLCSNVPTPASMRRIPAGSQTTASCCTRQNSQTISSASGCFTIRRNYTRYYW